MRLLDRRVVIAGAGGIGEAIADLAAAEGARIVIGDLNDDAAVACATRIIEKGGEAVGIGLDISDEASVAEGVSACADTFGGVDGLVNVAADLSPGTAGRDSDVLSIPLDVWDRVFHVDLRGFALTIRAALPLMLDAGGGSIVNISSGAAYIGEPVRPAYAAAKAGVNALTRHVASAWGRQGIRCNAVAPGLTVTPAAVATAGEDLVKMATEANPSGRLGEPQDIADAVVFLLSNAAAWVNGQVLSVDGGMTMR